MSKNKIIIVKLDYPVSSSELLDIRERLFGNVVIIVDKSFPVKRLVNLQESYMNKPPGLYIVQE